MRSHYIAFSLVLAVIALAGCSDEPAAADNNAAAGGNAAVDSAASTTVPANIALTSKGAPRRRDGYWEMGSFAEDGSPMSKQYLCVGANSEDNFSVFDQLAAVGDCDKNDFTRTSTGWTFETRCQLMKVVTVQKGTISGDFQDSFLVDQTVTQGADTTIKGTIRGKRGGECPAKYKPGDLVDGDGDVLGNILPL